ncbi:PR domain zinc finger protein 5 [Biomphalaria glabrata]
MEEIRACRTAQGNISGNVLLLDCITKTHHFLKKFLKLLWSRELKNLVQEIDSVLYEKLEANERTASDARTMTQEIEYMSGPVPKDDYQCQGYDANEDLMHDCNSSENTSVKMYPKKEIDFNIPINDLGDGSVSSIALNDLSDGSSIALSNPSGLSSPTYTKDCYSDDEGISTSVNESISVINSDQKMRNRSTYEKSTNLPLGRHDRAPRSLDGNQFSEDRQHFPDRKTPQFGLQSPNTTAYTHQDSNIFVDKKEDDKLSDYKSNSTKPQTLKIKSIKPIDHHETTKTPFKTSDNFKASPENKTLRELTKSAKTQEDRYRIHTDLSENTRSSASKPHSGTFKPPCQTPPNKLRAQASNDKKPSRMQDHVERPSRTPDLRNGSEKQGTMGKSTRSYDSDSSQRVQFYDCPFCKGRFSSDTNLQEHIKKTCGPKGDDHLRCKNCTKMFTEKATLDRHMRECSAGPLRELTSRQDNTPAHRPTQIYYCSQCTAKFMEKDKLKRHRFKYRHL